VNERRRPRWIVATVPALVVMMNWTVVVKHLAPPPFALSLAARGEPALEWTFWKLLWFTNEVHVLVLFVCLLYVLLGPGRRDLEKGTGDPGEVR